MPIFPLPHSTVEVLSSSQSITDSTSLIKELIENSLDAGASSVAVELSANALDVIQVKDDGYGIAQEDRDQLGRRHSTSKIRILDDLANIGGRFLGFRGVALASVAELSGALLVSTQIACEPVGEALKFDRNGNLKSRQPKSLPPGTTVRVEDFLKHIPVRRQASLRAVTRMQSRIKATIQSYALTRPNVRFAYKVLQDDKSQWVYAAPKGATMIDPAIKIYGIPAVTNCWIKFWSDSLGFLEDKEETPEGSGYNIVALLPKHDCESTAIKALGQHLSVDSRPVTCKRGTLKKIVDMFKSYLQQALGHGVSNPFLCLNLDCSPGSYDINIEPAKDDVLFVDEDIVIDAFHRFFGAVFEKRQNRLESIPSTTRETTPCFVDAKVYQSVNYAERMKMLDQAMRPQESGMEASHHSTTPKPYEPVTIAHKEKSILQELGMGALNSLDSTVDKCCFRDKSDHGKMPGTLHDFVFRGFDDFENLSLDLGSEDEVLSEEEENLHDVRISNPWSIAKLNAPIRKKPLSGQVPENLDFNGQLFTPPKLNTASSPVKSINRHTFIPPYSTPAVSPTRNMLSTSPGDTFRPRVDLPRQPNMPKKPTLHLDHRANANHQILKNTTRALGFPQSQKGESKQGPLDKWMRRPLPAPSLNSPPSFKSSQSEGLALADIPEISSRPRKSFKGTQRFSAFNKPFVSPVVDANDQQSQQQQKLKEDLSRRGFPAQWAVPAGAQRTLPQRSQLPRPSKELVSPKRQGSSSPSQRSYMTQKGTSLDTSQRQLPPGNIWLQQAGLDFKTASPSTRTTLPPEKLNQPQAPSATPPSIPSPTRRAVLLESCATRPKAPVPTLKVSTSSRAIGISFTRLLPHDAYLRSELAVQGLVFDNVDSAKVRVLASWDRQLRRLIAGMGGNVVVDGELSTAKALAGRR